MWAMMPMFRVFSSGACLAITKLPTVVRESLVRFGHAVSVFAFLDGAASEIRRVEQLVGQLLLHRLAVAPRAREANQPADAEREAAIRIHFDRDLVVRAANAARFHFERRLDVVDGLLEDLQRIVARTLLDQVEALIQDALRGGPLALAHDRVDELGDERALIERVRHQLT